ncbi:MULTISPECIES: hypothetical protein [unclassified Microbacterium]|uniref:hypothetical protein n=1 Tax=unclassified Microbacterium TaxID=2609290 RepID=UPI003019D227
MSSLTAYDIGEDGGMWLVVGQFEVHRETISVAEARLAVIALLREQLLPADHEVFTSETLAVLDAPARVHEYPIYSDPATERVYMRSPIGGTPIWGDRIGTCAVAIGFDLPDHRTVWREIGMTGSGGPL